jgi:predicted Zn finger-like uncharacterized protein
MKTRCPQCETVFRVSVAQLQARDGLVRCGRCLKVFQATDFAVSEAGDVEAVDSHMLPEQSAGVDTISRTEMLTVRANRADYGANDSADDLPSLRELLWGKQHSRTRPLFWLIGNLSLIVLLIAQIAYFYATELSRYPQFTTAIERYCVYAGCVVLPQQDIGLIELNRARVTPDPRYRNVLQLRASLINRATFSQGFPLIEISLTNGNGQVVARRAFSSDIYLTEDNAAEKSMPINVRFPVRLDFINPEKSATGFEVRLAAPPQPKPEPTIFTRFFNT